MSASGPMDRIDEFPLYIGSFAGAQNPQLLEKNNIEIVISLTLEKPSLDNGITHHHFPLQDGPNEDLDDILERTRTIIDTAEQQNQNVFVHCHGGVSRSSTIVLNYLLNKFDWGYDVSLHYLRDFRPIVQPCDYFEKKLREDSAVLKNTDESMPALVEKEKVAPDNSDTSQLLLNAFERSKQQQSDAKDENLSIMSSRPSFQKQG